jgi:tetratricopeptide (TPR) repeat protein/O-antigen ligase
LGETLWLAIMIVVPMTMNVSGVRSFETAKLAAVVPLAVLLFCALMVVRREGGGRPPVGAPRQPGLLGFAALVGCIIVATATSETPWIAFFGDYFRREGLVSWLVYATLFFGLLMLMRERTQLERLIDAILLASVVPCIYAVQQRYGLDVFVTSGLGGGGATARPGGMLGNPAFLSTYLLLVIPLTLVRCLGALKSWWLSVSWFALLGLQLFTILLTQSRGSLLGLAAALLLMAITIGAIRRSRALVVGTLGLALLFVVALMVLNLVPAVQLAFNDYPLIQRFMFTAGTNFTSNSRIGIWQAGVDAFLAAPWMRQLIGAGPDAAYFSYFPHLPAWVLRIEGYNFTIDRLHSELIETTMTFGLLGALAEAVMFSGLVWLAVARLAAPVPSPVRRASGFALLCCICALLVGILLVTMTGSRSLFPIGLGVGLALAWGIATTLAAWRGMGVVTHGNQADTVLLAALVCALAGFWIDAQVGVPSIASRSLVAVFAAIVLLIGTRGLASGAAPAPAAPGVKTQAPEPVMAGWMTSLGLMVSTSAFFPTLLTDAVLPPSPVRLNISIVPILGLLVAGGILAANEMHRRGMPAKGGLNRYLLCATIPWMAFVGVYVLLGAQIGDVDWNRVGERINALLALTFGVGLLQALAGAGALYLGDARQDASPDAKPSTVALLTGGLCLAAASYWCAMADVRADTYAKLGAWALGKGRAEESLALHRESAGILPAERRFSSAYSALLIERAAFGMNALRNQPAQATQVLDDLRQAEALIERMAAIAPRDPWITLARANVNQHFAQSLLESKQAPGERMRRAKLAREYFEAAHRQFPAYVGSFRFWAQLEFDLGDRAAGYARFDTMEAIDPLNTAIYLERLRFTSEFGDHGVAIAALRKGIALQPPGSQGLRDLRGMLAQYFEQMGRPDQALNTYLEMIDANANDFAAVLNAADLYARSGRRVIALAVVQNALKRIVGLPSTAKLRADQKNLEALAAQLAGSGESLRGPSK